MQLIWAVTVKLDYVSKVDAIVIIYLVGSSLAWSATETN